MYKTIDDIADLQGKKVLLRADLNVPLKDGAVSDATRIVRVAPTLKELMAKGAKLIVCSHWGRPKGQRVEEMSLSQVVPALEAELGQKVAFASDCTGAVAADVVNALEDGQIALLENLRYHAGEEKNAEGFAKDLAGLADLFIMDAFSCAHRAHASTEAITRELPAYIGRAMEAEVNALSSVLDAPKKPVAAIVGGAKVSTKMELLTNLVTKVDVLVIGGGMANTFLFARGIDVGKSLCEKDMADMARDIEARAKEAGCEIVLPVDGVCSAEFAANPPITITDNADIPADQMVLDAGPKSIAAITEALAKCNTLVWNGPFGAFEMTPFDKATIDVAQFVVAEKESRGLVAVAGGGDTVAALAHANALDGMTYVSTAGGAFLEWMEGKELPGLKALADAAA